MGNHAGSFAKLLFQDIVRRQMLIVRVILWDTLEEWFSIGLFCPSGDIWWYLETFFIVMTGDKGDATGIQWVEAGTPLNILQYTGLPPAQQRMIWFKMSIVARPRNPALEDLCLGLLRGWGKQNNSISCRPGFTINNSAHGCPGGKFLGSFSHGCATQGLRI